MDKTKQLALTYDTLAESYAKEFFEPSEHIDDFLKLIPLKGKILDVGCGVGVDSEYMISNGFDVIGVDLSGKMLSLAKQRFPRGDFRLGDMRKLTFQDFYFDGIFASFSLIHIPKKDLSGLLIKLGRMLKETGAIHIALQEGKSGESFIRGPLESKEKFFLNIMSFEEIKELLNDAGFFILAHHERRPKKNELKFTKLHIIARKKFN